MCLLLGLSCIGWPLWDLLRPLLYIFGGGGGGLSCRLKSMQSSIEKRCRAA